MNNKEVEKRINHLRNILLKANELYYQGLDTGIPDDVYNQMFKEVSDLEKKYPELVTADSVTLVVGHSRKSALKSVRHSQPMLSLYTEVDHTIKGAEDFVERVTRALKRSSSEGFEYTVEPKYDGASLRLIYDNGVLKQAITRGDGQVGEDVTHNAVHITNIPQVLKDNPETTTNWRNRRIEVCGEVMIPLNNFARLVEEAVRNGKKPPVNARNLAAGTIRTLDSVESARRGLFFMAYDVIAEDLLPKHSLNLTELGRYGLEFETYRIARTVEELYASREFLLAQRGRLNYEIDGVVYKLNDLSLREELGFTSREPRWAMAHKFIPEAVITKVLDIEVQIGRTGKATPVARIDPVFVGGVMVSNATLHNLAQVRKKNVKVGDEVIIQRAGDVIPEILSVIPAPPWAETELKPDWEMPEACPLCASPIVISEDLKHAKCTGGIICPGQVLQGLIHMCSRNALNIQGLADKSIEELLDRGMIKDKADLLSLKKEDFLKLDGWQEKSAVNAVTALDTAKATTLPRLLISLGIPGVGEGTSKALSDTFFTMDKVMAATEDELLLAKDIGPVSAQLILDYFSKPENVDLVKRILASGIIVEKHAVTTGPFSGLTFVTTGSFEIKTRDELEDWIKQLGGKVSGNISKKTNFLVVGEGGGGKREKAEALGVKTISEVELYKLV